MGGSRGSQPSDTSKAVRYAPYVENRHADLINTVAALHLNLVTDSPYGTYENQDVDSAMFGAGFAITDFASLYDMYGKFMAGYDVESSWNVAMTDQAEIPDVNASVHADGVMLDENVVIKDSPSFKLMMRNQNAVNSSSFVVGKALIECQRVTDFVNLSADSTFRLLPDVSAKHNTTLNWQKGTTDSYAELMKLYYLIVSHGREADTTFAARHLLWPFDILDFERAVLGTMRQNAGFQRTSLQRKRSTVSKIFLSGSWTATGAFIGSEVGGFYGAVAGAIVGFTIGVANVLFE